MRDHQAGADAPERKQMAEAGWVHRRRDGPASRRSSRSSSEAARSRDDAGGADAHGRSVRRLTRPRENRFDPAKQQHTGVVLGIAMASYRTPDGRRPVSASCPATT